MELGNYKCSGKKYNGEKAIISLTSWKARINTVSKTLYSLLRNCPGFHIVLVLSEEEFPKMEKELPENLMLFVKGKYIEILWVYKNYKSFKKVLFTMDKYRDVPIISADDDCIYVLNYAELLYSKWLQNKKCSVSFGGRLYNNTYFTWGCATLWPPYCFGEMGVKWVDDFAVSMVEDDKYYAALKSILGIPTSFTKEKRINDVLRFEETGTALRNSYRGKDMNRAYNAFMEHIKK